MMLRGFLTAWLTLPALAADGKAAFDKACKTCHGANGEGNPKIAQMMKLTMKPLASKEVQARADADLKRIVTKGEGKMKPVANLAGPDVDAIVAYLRTFK